MNKLNSSPGHIALELLRIGALNIADSEPYWLSSKMRSPMYCDNRLTLAHPPLLDKLVSALSRG